MTGIPTCQYVYKRGKNKGTQCMCKKPKNLLHDVFHFPWYCKSHYKQCKTKVEQINNSMNNPLIGQNIVIKV